jgi:hypothetical protein
LPCGDAYQRLCRVFIVSPPTMGAEEVEEPISLKERIATSLP